MAIVSRVHFSTSVDARLETLADFAIFVNEVSTGVGLTSRAGKEREILVCRVPCGSQALGWTKMGTITKYRRTNTGRGTAELHGRVRAG